VIGGIIGRVGKLGRELMRATAHGAFNGSMRMAQGGKFEHGFLSGFVSSLGGSVMQSYGTSMSTMDKIVLSSVIGGTAEALGGGKFSNGAVTGAFVEAYNHLQYQIEVNEFKKKWSGFPQKDYDYLSDSERAEHIFNAIKYSNENGMNGMIPLNSIFDNLKNNNTLQNSGIKINKTHVAIEGYEYTVQIIIPLFNSTKTSAFLGTDVQLKGGYYKVPFNNGWYRNYNPGVYQIAVFGESKFELLMNRLNYK
jgi:hypothetical protein